MQSRRKIRVRESKGGFKMSDYQGWLEKRGNYDFSNPDDTWDGQSPWAPGMLSDLEADHYEAFEELYIFLKGRQRQVARLLLKGFTNQTQIARRLKIDQREVVVHLRRIAKKIIKRVCSYALD